jgi:dienelactone hydrolase
MEQRYAAGIGWFDYRESEPLDISVERSTEVDGIETKSITYASSTGRSVPAALVAPAEHAGLPGIIWLCPCGPVVDRAQEFAPLGSIVITIDAPQMRPDGFALTYSEQDKDELIELIIELRRAVDVLIESGADPNRIAFIGYSWGAAMGGVLAGVEPRIGAYAFMFGDGGLVEHALETPDAGFTAALSDAALDAWLRTMEPLESLYFIPFASRSRLLFQNGRYDDTVAEVSARRFQEYASDPKDIRWYDSGHDPTPDAPEVWCDLAKWLKVELELSSSDIAECG